MADLEVVALIKAKPGSEQTIWDALSGLAAETRNEEGCISYELMASSADAATFVTIEKWRSAEDLDAHMKSPHMAAAIATAGQHFAANPEIHPLKPSPSA